MSKYKNLPYVILDESKEFDLGDIVCAQPMIKPTSLIFTFSFNWNDIDHSLYCSCNNRNKKHIVISFNLEYDYCTNCKKEIKCQ